MSTAHPSLISGQQSALSELPLLSFWIVTFSLLPIAALFGGMVLLLMSLSVVLAAIVYQRPQEAAGAGILYLFACNVLLPHSARFDGVTKPWEMYYWAAGLLIVTAGGVAGVGVRRVLTVPRSAKAFLLVSLLAALYGLTHGASFSYVVRQFYDTEAQPGQHDDVQRDVGEQPEKAVPVAGDPPGRSCRARARHRLAPVGYASPLRQRSHYSSGTITPARPAMRPTAPPSQKCRPAP